jgi:hypothetical protein
MKKEILLVQPSLEIIPSEFTKQDEKHKYMHNTYIPQFQKKNKYSIYPTKQ